jgi:uncharacterized protein YjbI with pentapeptide repeats
VRGIEPPFRCESECLFTGKIASDRQWLKPERKAGTQADLHDAKLDKANLGHASLSFAYLTGAKLNYANLTGADLNAANLTRAVLTNATLTGAGLDLPHPFVFKTHDEPGNS